jgi:HJR/Mrr/RecB family endonuclease/DNA-directed RNA polymerase subunit RPC12/RpoP
MIWEYSQDDYIEPPLLYTLGHSGLYHEQGLLTNPIQCPYCLSGLTRLGYSQGDLSKSEFFNLEFPTTEQALYVCQTCGNWNILSCESQLEEDIERINHNNDNWFSYDEFNYSVQVRLYGIFSSLKRFDIADIKAPTEELKRYLVHNFDDRLLIHPKKLEDIVGSVFKEDGFEIRATAYSKDKGIDLFFFDHGRSDLVGIQVKRSNNKIDCNLIDRFEGALIRNNTSKGIFITTSSYTKVAREYANEFSTKAIPMELWDADKLFDRIKITLRDAYAGPNDETAPFFKFWNNEYMRMDAEYEMDFVEFKDSKF